MVPLLTGQSASTSEATALPITTTENRSPPDVSTTATVPGTGEVSRGISILQHAFVIAFA